MDLIADFSGVGDRRKIRQVLVEWAAFLYAEETIDKETGEKQKRYQLFHDTFNDFIAAKEEVAEERVDLEAVHRKMADFMWQELFGDD